MVSTARRTQRSGGIEQIDEVVSALWRGPRRRVLAGALPLLAAWVLAACAEEPTSIDDFDTVVTLYDRDAEFGGYRTYAMPDSVVHIGTDATERLSRAHDDLIMSEIAAQMAAAGYVRVTDPAGAPPDLVVLAGVTSSAHVGYATYPGDYWDWWYGWDWWVPLDASWGFYYPWYSSTVVYVYRTGTLLIDIFDPRLRDDQLKLMGSLWIGAVNGLLHGSDAELATRIQDGVERAFEQSPYLQSNGRF